MKYGIVLERIEDGSLPPEYYYAHVPALGLTTHGLGVEGARAAAAEMIRLWVAEMRASGEPVTVSSDVLDATVDVDDAL
ncbi:type II toxin-antitoxin system HicB family antitoxin [bacterium]|nr:type II toxin-antitoxin system HicB family antitoxin [bacterium]